MKIKLLIGTGLLALLFVFWFKEKELATDRFAKELVSKTFATSLSIITDKQTGVQYLFYKCGYGAGLTKLESK